MALPVNERSRGPLSRARQRCLTWPLTEVQFNLQTGWARKYGDLFAGRFSSVLEEGQILDSVLDRGRAILTGRAGDGKTWLLRRLYKRVLERDSLPVFIDLKQWTGADYEDWNEWTSEEVGDAADFLVRKFGGIDVGAIDLDRLPPTVSKVLLVDGLNEITSPVGLQILQLLDQLVRDQIDLSVIVADRLTRRELPSSTRWSIGVVLPLSEGEVHKHLDSKFDIKRNGLLTSPFFLDAAVKYQIEGHRRSQASQRFLTVHGGVSEPDLDRVGEAAFDAYHRSRSRVFDRVAFAELAGEAPVTALEQSGTITSTAGGRAYFVHHILHDYLAARHFAQRRVEEWTPQALTVLSFDASSFDAVELVFEQLDEGRADLFLQQLYDWNLYAAGYALAQARDTGVSAGKEMRIMILAMLAEKRFDPVLATRQKADDALALMQLSDARPFRDASSLDAVISILDSIPSSEGWFNSWKRLFQTKQSTQLSPEILATIRNSDSIAGWTVANVAKRTTVDDRTFDLVVAWLDGEPSVSVRWRIAHVLGAHSKRPTLEALLRLLDDDADGSVRYGAIRSIVELATRANIELRDSIANALLARAESISRQPKISGELRTSLLIHPDLVAPGWLKFVANIVRALFSAVDSTHERDLWRRCLNEAEDLYSNASGKIGEATQRRS